MNVTLLTINHATRRITASIQHVADVPLEEIEQIVVPEIDVIAPSAAAPIETAPSAEAPSAEAPSDASDAAPSDTGPSEVASSDAAPSAEPAP